MRPGAEAWSAAGGPAGALCLHGFAGSPHALRPQAEALAAAGFTVELPRLPGHGTAVADMLPTRWADWAVAADDAYADLAERCRALVVVGQSMGAALAAALAARHREIAGIVAINPLVEPHPAEVAEMLRAMVAGGERTVPAGRPDLADPDAVDIAYTAVPLEPLLSLHDGLALLDLAGVTCPVLLLTSAQDHVVDPTQSEHFAAVVSGPVERVTLPRSFHVATLDHDRDLVTEQTVAFARRVTAAAGA